MPRVLMSSRYYTTEVRVDAVRCGCKISRRNHSLSEDGDQFGHIYVRDRF